MVENVYDVVRYPNSPRPTALPSKMAVHAHLRGRPFVPFSASRVLEIGCSEGGNLMSLAAMAPRSEFVGFDLASAPIAYGAQRAAAAGLHNVTLHVGDILDPDVVSGEFDYIIAHGMYAWIAQPVREAMLTLIGRVLSPHGLAFVSYNAAPGANVRTMLREVLLTGLNGIDDPAARIAKMRELVGFYAAIWEDRTPLQAALAALAKGMLQRSAESIFHDELGPIYEPQRLDATVAAARRHGLDYLSDTNGSQSGQLFFPTQGVEWTNDSWIDYEQVRDFVTMRPFRETLLCRPGVPRRPVVGAALLRPLHAQGSFRRRPGDQAGVIVFDLANGGTLDVRSEPVAALLDRIGAAYPLSVPLTEIEDPTAEALLRLFCDDELALLTEPLRFTLEPGLRPVASTLARLEAESGHPYISTLFHMGKDADGRDQRLLISLLDGTRTRVELAEEMARRAGRPVNEAVAELPEVLAEVARLGVLLAVPSLAAEKPPGEQSG